MFKIKFMITIHYDFKDGTELSYSEGILAKDVFNTNCLEFFSFDTEVDDVIIVNSKRQYIRRSELLLNNGKYTSKEIRKEHNIYRMFLANSLKWQEYNETNIPCIFTLADLNIISTSLNRLYQSNVDYLEWKTDVFSQKEIPKILKDISMLMDKVNDFRK